jgi:ferritin-like metal-binding protein YciE
VTRPITDERALFVLRLRTLLGIEHRLAHVLPSLAGEATDVQLRHGLERHVAETRRHLLNVETALRSLGEEPSPHASVALQGLERAHAERVAALWSEAPPELHDLVVAETGAHLEHLEIGSYQAAHQQAELLGEEDAAELLHSNLEEERAMLDEGEAVSHRLASTLVHARLRS